MDFRELMADPPKVHPTADGGTFLMPPGEAALQYLHDHVGPRSVTLETGCGVSTAVFAIRGASHTCITPSFEEIDNLKHYLHDKGVPFERVTFVAQRSSAFLPRLNGEVYDLVLIDGCHNYTSVVLDWHHLSARVKVGGIVVIDNTDISTGEDLRRFVCEEPEWRLEVWHQKQTACFRKLAEYDPGKSWVDQPWVERHSRQLKRRQRRQYFRERAASAAQQFRFWRTTKDLIHAMIGR